MSSLDTLIKIIKINEELKMFKLYSSCDIQKRIASLILFALFAVFLTLSEGMS